MFNCLLDKTVSQLFEECAQIYGNRIAVYSDTKHCTYSELNAKANKLANHLRQCGVRPNTLVALYLARSVKFVIAMLAVIKAGGAYIPLDIDDTSSRTKKILQNSNPVVTITSTASASLAREIISERKCINIDTFFQDNIENDTQNPVCMTVPEDLIYVMYTSGSTGEPKGCMIPHRGVVRLVKNTNYIQINPSDCIAQISNVAFDALTFEIWGALLNGASVYIVPRSILLSFEDFSEALKQKQISIVFVTTALLNLIVKNRPDSFDGFKYLLFGGEKANVEIVKTLMERKRSYNLSNLTLIHVYGPTENTTFATAYRIESEEDIDKNVPIGKPISHTKAHILDEKLNPVPPGVIGELHLAGAGLALGYLNNQLETAAKFIQSPWNEKEKIYRTGDLVYELPDIGMVFVERADRQIKIRGFRTELNEIEACIIKYPDVKQAVIAVEKNQERGDYLVAYICLFESKEIDIFAFRSYLKESLPYYMLLAKIIQLDNIPLTANGKIDQKFLKELKGKNLLVSLPQAQPPLTEIEKTIAEIWQKILHLPEVSITQNFFDLGAHSLMISEVCSVLNTKLTGVKKIRPADMYTYPNIQSLAAYLSKEEATNISIALEHEIDRGKMQRRTLTARRRGNGGR